MIFVDGSADVDLQAVGEENIKFIPMEYSLAGEMRVCDTMQDRQTLKAVSYTHLGLFCHPASLPAVRVTCFIPCKNRGKIFVFFKQFVKQLSGFFNNVYFCLLYTSHTGCLTVV